jgi:hypothetical protein
VVERFGDRRCSVAGAFTFRLSGSMVADNSSLFSWLTNDSEWATTHSRFDLHETNDAGSLFVANTVGMLIVLALICSQSTLVGLRLTTMIFAFTQDE